MTKDDAEKKIVDLLSVHTNLDAERLAHLAQRIYNEVVAPSVEAERDTWVDLAVRADLLDS